MAKELLKSKYSIKSLISEEQVSYCYMGEAVSARTAVLIWKYKKDYLSSRLVKKMIQLSEQLILFQHPNILKMIDYYYDGMHFYTIYQFTDNLISLDAWMESRKTVDSKSVFRICSQVLTAMSAMENSRLLYGRLSLANIYLNPRLEVKLSNILLPLVVLKKSFNKFPVIEDGMFLAPEFLQYQQFSNVSDVYSLGVLLYYVYTRQWPYKFTEDILKLKASMLHLPLEPKKLNPKLSDKLNRVIQLALAQDPARRFRTVTELEQCYLGNSNYEMVMPMPTANSPYQNDFRRDLQKMKKRQMMRASKYAGVITSSILALIIGMTMYTHYVTAIPEVTVPNVVGMSMDQAERELSKAGLRCIKMGTQYSTSIPGGCISSMKPPAGRAVKKNRVIQLLISQGGLETGVPALVGKTMDYAKSFAEQHNLDITVSAETYSLKFARGMIMSQSPSPDAQISAGKTISVIVSKGYPVSITVQAPSDTASASPGDQEVLVNLNVIKGWPDQDVRVTYLLNGSSQVLYSQLYSSGQSETLSFTVPSGGTMEVYYNYQLAARRFVAVPKKKVDAQPDIQPIEVTGNSESN